MQKATLPSSLHHGGHDDNVNVLVYSWPLYLRRGDLSYEFQELVIAGVCDRPILHNTRMALHADHDEFQAGTLRLHANNSVEMCNYWGAFHVKIGNYS